MYNRRSFAVTPRTIGGILDDVFQNGWNQLNEEVSAFQAPVNIQETDTAYELHVVAAGLRKEDFKLSIDKNILTISYDHKEESNENGNAGKWLRKEYKLKSFKRNFTLNDKVEAGKIAAKYNDGILTVTMPKKETTEVSTQEIPVN